MEALKWQSIMIKKIKECLSLGQQTVLASPLPKDLSGKAPDKALKDNPSIKGGICADVSDAEPDEVGALYAFLASSEAAYIAGADIRIDGEETAGLA